MDDIPAALATVTVFKNVVDTPVVSALLKLIVCYGIMTRRIQAYCDFVGELYKANKSLDTYLLDAVCGDENIYVKLKAAKKDVSPLIEAAVKNELEVLSLLTHINPEELIKKTGYSGFLPEFENSPCDISKAYNARIAKISEYGYGIYAAHRMFRLDAQRIVPVYSPDDIHISDLIGYDYERSQVLENTQALLDGKPASNLLLVGDAGTGKSSTVKAAVNELYMRGLRLIELKKNQILYLPEVMEQLKENPLKFIVFIDDLSFNRNDDSFGTLKAILEGSATAKSNNSIIYATSNRRHLIKESFSDRAGDDVHINDTMQELLSLSDRFGQTILFSKPDKKLYLTIVHALAERNGLTDMPDIDRAAEEFALRKGGRSARAAEQFVNHLVASL